MMITSKDISAINAVVDVALNSKIGPVSLSDISKRQDISLSYLEQHFSKLRKSGIVESIKGPGGGYKLAVVPKLITVKMIVLSISPMRSSKNNILSSKIDCFLSDISIESLMVEDFFSEKSIS